METPLVKQHHLFWEVEPTQIKDLLKRSPHWVLERVLQYGTMEDILDAVDFYGMENLKFVIDNQPLKRRSRVLAKLVYKEYKPSTLATLRNS